MKNKTHQPEPTLLTVQLHAPKYKEMEEQMKLIKQIKEIEKTIHFEENEQKSIVDKKKEEIVIRTQSIEQLTQTNQFLQTELENLRLQIGTDDKMNIADKQELQDKNAKFENERRQKQDQLEQKLKDKEIELKNSLTIIDKYQQEKDILQKQLNEQVDIIQINAINEEIKIAHSKIETLEKEITYLKYIEKEHSNCTYKEQQVKNEINLIKEQINLLNIKYKNQRKCNSLSSIFHIYKEEELHKQEEQEKIMKQNLNKFWKEHKDKLSQQQQVHVNTKSNNPNKKKKAFNINVKQEEKNKRIHSKYEIAKQINNRNILLSATSFKDKNNKTILPPIVTKSLFNKKEKEILLNVLPEKEIQKYEKRFEIIDNTKNNMVRKYHLEEKKLNKENKELESRVEFSEMQLKVNEQKNKLLKKQIEKYNTELGSLDDKLKELNDMLTLQNTQINEKENENKMLILKLQELQCESKTEKKEEKNKENEEEENEKENEEENEDENEEKEEEVEVKETERENKQQGEDKNE